MKFEFKGLLQDKKIPIPEGPGEPRFHKHYHAARADQKLKTKKLEKLKKGVLDELCDKHLKWVINQVIAGSLSKGTLTSRRTGLKQACETLDPDGDRMGAFDADLSDVASTHIQDGF